MDSFFFFFSNKKITKTKQKTNKKVAVSLEAQLLEKGRIPMGAADQYLDSIVTAKETLTRE